MQRLRDEAHRFAITYHRSLRAKAATRSAFDDLPGVGPKRRAALLRVFGSAKRVREAPVEQVAAVPGIGDGAGGEDQGGAGGLAARGRVPPARAVPPNPVSSRLVRRIVPILILAIGAIALFIDMPDTSFFVLSNPNGGFTQKTQVNLGLDLKGGFSATYRVAPGQGTPSSSQMETSAKHHREARQHHRCGRADRRDAGHRPDPGPDPKRDRP